jgi:hypothetical protein
MYTDSLIVEVSPVVNSALRGCKYSVDGIRQNFAVAAQGASEFVRPQVQDVGAWLAETLQN